MCFAYAKPRWGPEVDGPQTPGRMRSAKEKTWAGHQYLIRVIGSLS